MIPCQSEMQSCWRKKKTLKLNTQIVLLFISEMKKVYNTEKAGPSLHCSYIT